MGFLDELENVNKEKEQPVQAPKNNKTNESTIKTKEKKKKKETKKNKNNKASFLDALDESQKEEQTPKKASQGLTAFSEEDIPLKKEFFKTGVEGFDKLIEKGIPTGTASLVCGGPGSGKTLFCLQTLMNSAKAGKKCFYMSFEEKVERLRDHMHDFGWEPETYEANGTLVMRRFDPFEVTRSVEALMAKAKGELLIDVAPVVFPADVNPEVVIIDSLSSIGAAFSSDDGYRTYIEQLFKLFENMGVTSFFISELVEDKLGSGGSAVEQFLADNVIIIYNIRKQNVRESAIEILKMRGTKFQKRIVAMQILNGVGVEVYPEQKVYGGTGS